MTTTLNSTLPVLDDAELLDFAAAMVATMQRTAATFDAILAEIKQRHSAAHSFGPASDG